MKEKINKSVNEQIVDIAENNGWTVNVVTDSSNRDVEMEFSKFMGCWDYSFQINFVKNNINHFLQELYDFYDGFDPDYEAYLWIGEDGHGKNGAPYYIKDILSETEYTDTEIKKLYNEMREKLECIDED